MKKISETKIGSTIERKYSILGAVVVENNIKTRRELERDMIRGNITGAAYWSLLKITFAKMSAEEKALELDNT